MNGYTVILRSNSCVQITEWTVILMVKSIFVYTMHDIVYVLMQLPMLL